MKHAAYPGSFDPFTNGHLDIVLEASKLFDKVTVIISTNVKKKKVFEQREMLKAIQKTVQKQGLNNVEVIESNLLTADICQQINANYLVRGLRNATDYAYEEDIAKINKELNPVLTTVYLRAIHDIVSSSLVRELMSYGRDVSKYVPSDVLAVMKVKVNQCHQMFTSFNTKEDHQNG